MQLIESNEIAKFFEVSPEIIGEWCEKGMPKNSDGKFDLCVCAKWRISQLQDELDKRVYLSRQEIVELLGYKNEKYINKLESKYGLPKDGYNKYDIRKVIKWFVEYKEMVHERELNKIMVGNNRDRVDKARAELMEIDLAIRKGTLIGAVEFEEALNNIASIFIKGLNIIEVKIPKLLGLETNQKEIIDAEIHSIRDQIGNSLSNISPDKVDLI